MGQQEKAIEIIKEELENNRIKVLKIILFGSRAKGNYTKDSDWDFFIIINKELNRSEKWNIILRIKRCLASLKIPNDIFISSQRKVNAKKKDVGHLIYYALKYGTEI